MSLKVYSRRKQLALETPYVPIIQPKKGTNSIDPDTQKKGNDFLSLNALDLPIALTKEKRQCTQHPLIHFVSLEKLSPSYQAFLSKLNSIETPKTVQEALRNDNWGESNDGRNECTNKKITHERKVACKWVFTTKFRANGTLERYKTRLVAKGYAQTHGIDYHEAFAPMAKMNTIQILLSLGC